MRLIVALLCLARALASGTVYFNFAACDNEDSCGSVVTWHDDANSPPFSDADSGFVTDLMTELCSSKAFTSRGMTCVGIVDIWKHIWTGDDAPGPGLIARWYDVAFSATSTRRAMSCAYSYIVAFAPEYVMVVLDTRTDGVPEGGEGETVATKCGLAANPVASKHYAKAKVLSNPSECAVDTHAQLKMLDKGDATVALMTTGDWLAISSAGTSGYALTVDRLNLAALYPSDLQNGMAFLFHKRSSCLKTLFNAALEEVRASGAMADLCSRHPLVNCTLSRIEREDLFLGLA